MQDNKQMIEAIREAILGYEVKVKELQNVMKQLVTAREYLDALMLSEGSDANTLSGPETALKVFETSPEEDLSIGDIGNRMKMLGWRTGASRPEAVVGGMLHRDPRFVRTGRGHYRLNPNAAAAVDETAATEGAPQEGHASPVPAAVFFGGPVS